MKKIGITGGIGSGKSLVCKIFAALGIPVYDADSRARWITDNHPDVVAAVKTLLGDDVYSDGVLDRKKVAAMVFPAPELLNGLNRIIHPAVGRDFENWVGQKNAPYIIKEAALMFESGSYLSLDAVIHVYAPEEVRIQRILMRDPHRSRQEIRNIIARQMSAEDIRQKSQYEIVNDNVTLVIPQVLKLHQEFLDK